MAHCYWAFEAYPNTPGLLDALFLFFSLGSALFFVTCPKLPPLASPYPSKRLLVVYSINEADTGPHGHRTEFKEGHSQVEKEHKKQEWKQPELHKSGEPRWKSLLGSCGKGGHLSEGMMLSQKAVIWVWCENIR